MLQYMVETFTAGQFSVAWKCVFHFYREWTIFSPREQNLIIKDRVISQVFIVVFWMWIEEEKIEEERYFHILLFCVIKLDPIWENKCSYGSSVAFHCCLHLFEGEILLRRAGFTQVTYTVRLLTRKWTRICMENPACAVGDQTAHWREITAWRLQLEARGGGLQHRSNSWDACSYCEVVSSWSWEQWVLAPNSI